MVAGSLPSTTFNHNAEQSFCCMANWLWAQAPLSFLWLSGSRLDCYAGLPIKYEILPLLKLVSMMGKVTSHHVGHQGVRMCLSECKLHMPLPSVNNAAQSWNPEKTSPEVQNRDITVAPLKGHMSTKTF